MNQIQTFNHAQFGKVRCTMIEGAAWFVGKDVATALGYKNTKDALAKHVDDEDKRVIQKSQNATLEIPNRGLTIINESGMYSLVLSSKLPEAVKVRHWITSQVMPQLFRTGGNFYVNPDWKKVRNEGKVVRKKLTDAVKIFAEYAANQGTSRNEKVFYSQISRQVNQAVGLPNKKARDFATVNQLKIIDFLEDGISNILLKGTENNIPYKKIEISYKNWIKDFLSITSAAFLLELSSPS